MKGPQKAILVGLSALVLVALAAVILTRGWSNYRERLRAIRAASKHPSTLVDTHALDTAQQLAPLAVTRSEREYAQEALRLADYSVDLTFAAALQDATENQMPLTPETRAIAARIKTAEATVANEQDRVAQLTQQVAKARGSAKENLQEQLDLVQAQLELDQDDLDDAHLDLARAGGDKRATIQRLRAQHEAAETHSVKTDASASTNATPSPETTQAQNLVAQFRAWSSLHAKEILLRQAQQNAFVRAAGLSTTHEALKKQLDEEKAQKKILHKKSAASSGVASPSQGSVPAEPPSAISVLRQLASDQKDLSQLAKRIENEQELAAVYGNWIALVTVRERAFLHGMLLSLFWILLVALVVTVANQLIRRFFSDLSPEARNLHTMRAAILVSVQALGVVLILLVIFGVPSQLGTVLALAGAGLTVAMKDFIVGFIGWFVLMGKGGIRPGDWVEINGVGGEVLEVGLLHTVLLETGNWADAAHPTGRKVTFVNSFAIEGHFFNFSTAGQWLWDELQVLVPIGADAYSIAEEIQKIAAEETAANARLAEQEWERVAPAYASRSFSAVPSMSVRPTVGGVNIYARYITRANERQEVRTRLYRAVVELLHARNVPESAAPKGPPQPGVGPK
ncbi:MAG: mechanosensitive ion channel domain-containing protein [Candidatus Acidiferrales bacterium]